MIKYVVAIIGIILAILGVVFGSFLPFMKSTAYVSALRKLDLGRIKTTNDFKNEFGRALDFYSPAGDEELFIYVGELISRLIASKKLPETAGRELADFIEPRLSTLKEDARYLLVVAAVYEQLWLNYERAADYQKTVDYYERVLVIGPRLPHALYKLFDLYRLGGDFENAKRIGETILKHWPNDKEVGEILKAI